MALGRHLLASRGVEPSPLALAGAMAEVEYRETILAFLRGLGGGG